VQLYRPRQPHTSPLRQCLNRHFDAFCAGYEARFQPRYGFLRPIIPEVVGKFLDCGDLEHGFARVRCDNCQHEYCRIAHESLLEYMQTALNQPDGLPGIVMCMRLGWRLQTVGFLHEKPHKASGV